jgi:hypothetical protein
MVKIPGYDLDSTELEKMAEHAGAVNSALFEAKLRTMNLQEIIGLKSKFHDEQQMFKLIVEAQYHVIAAQRCIEALHDGIEDVFKENDIRYGVNFHSMCDDCDMDTTDPNEHEYYMVLDDLWAQARKQPVNGKPELPVTATLCIGCLEARLGRQLVSTDFQYTIGVCSARLQDRTKAAE